MEGSWVPGSLTAGLGYWGQDRELTLQPQLSFNSCPLPPLIPVCCEPHESLVTTQYPVPTPPATVFGYKLSQYTLVIKFPPILVSCDWLQAEGDRVAYVIVFREG